MLVKKGEEFDWKDYPFFEKLSKKEQKEFIMKKKKVTKMGKEIIQQQKPKLY
jgi:hypothetical protein